LQTERSFVDHLSGTTFVSKPPDKTSLLSLPVELFDMILSYYNDIEEDDILGNPTTLPLEYRERADVLRALSQTCKGLRAACLPLAWERMEACTANPAGAWYQQVSARLENASKFIPVRPYLAEHVRIVTVSITRCSTETVLPPFIRCLESLPNLHTLQLVHVHSEMTTTLKEAFEGHTFPRIRNVILPSCAHNILRCCPEVRQVVCNEDDGGKLITAIRRGCKKVEGFHGIKPIPNFFNRLHKAAPKLRELSIDTRFENGRHRGYADEFLNGIKRVSLFKNLRTIHLTIGENLEYPQNDIEKIFDAQITAAQDVLKGVVVDGEKKLTVTEQMHSRTPDWYWNWVTVETKELIIP